MGVHGRSVGYWCSEVRAYFGSCRLVTESDSQGVNINSTDRILYNLQFRKKVSAGGWAHLQS